MRYVLEKNILERIQKRIINGDKIRHGKLQYNINKETIKTAALSSSKIDKYEYLTGIEMLLSEESRTREQAKFIYSPLEQVLEKKQKRLKTKEENK